MSSSIRKLKKQTSRGYRTAQVASRDKKKLLEPRKLDDGYDADFCFSSDDEGSDADILSDSSDDNEVAIAETVNDEGSDDEQEDERSDVVNPEKDAFAAVGTISRPSDPFFLGKNYRKWWKEPQGPKNARTPASHIFKDRRRTSNETKTANLFEIFGMIISKDLKDIIVKCTNTKAESFYAAWNEEHSENHKTWKPMTMDELNCFIGKIKILNRVRVPFSVICTYVHPI